MRRSPGTSAGPLLASGVGMFRSTFRPAPPLGLALVLATTGCTASAVDAGDANPFLAGGSKTGKADTDYQNPEGIEVEVDIEADVDAPSFRRADAPAQLGQFAMTYLRERREFYLESLAEDLSSRDRVEWLVDSEWVAAKDAVHLEPEALTHFRIRGVIAILLRDAGIEPKVGATLSAEVPARPYSVMGDAGDTCADRNSHIELSQSVYWYLWNPERPGCTVDTQAMSITVSSVFSQAETYPEYDRLVEDGKVTAVILYGQIGDGPIDDYEIGVRNMKRMVSWLTADGFNEASAAPVGRRFQKAVGDVTFELDLYSPNDFSGLGDYANFGNLQRAITEHEIVVYDGHSMLGASDFWSRPEYPDNYQIFIYGGCLGYEYYV
ncbi:MAG: hypothetical protein KC417_10820, partial [Myxococcales bacterium]|nr:hypothetical protein [Myxococcales bacterium]